MLGFVVVHGNFEHVVAADANAVNFWGSFPLRAGWRGVRRWLRLMCFRHEWILTCRSRQILDEGKRQLSFFELRFRTLKGARGRANFSSSGLAFAQQVENGRNDFADANGAI